MQFCDGVPLTIAGARSQVHPHYAGRKQKMIGIMRVEK
jgi:hypothetical protein